MSRKQFLPLALVLCLSLFSFACGSISVDIQSDTPTAPAYDSSGLATRAPGSGTAATPTTAFDTSGLATRAPAGSASATPTAPQSDSSGLATRPPATKRAVTPTQAAVVSGYETIAASALPPEARHTLELIASNGPFPYKQDGVVFSNREQILPKKSSGYYHEYTVVTPGSPDRGARRIIKGQQGELFYTDDHYATFKVILTDE